jgi:methylisocitrate lyase
MTPAARLRQRLAHPGLILAPACATPMSALVAQQEGFEAVALGGYALVPVVVDGGAGFGEPLHTMRTVRELEQVGAAAVHIEDQIFPKRAHYHRDYREHVIPAEAMVEKIAYAVRARRHPDFLVIARTDAMQTDGYAEGVRRARLYAEAGADMVMLFPKTAEEARQAPRDCGVPLVWIDPHTAREARLGVERVIGLEEYYRIEENTVEGKGTQR